ncbi:MAG TPA: alpha/beta fold hydrolase [Pseudolysinimonas sp.]|nr:alpha/beta fold hydrolase [Pseudolysinimonas sp.]
MTVPVVVATATPGPESAVPILLGPSLGTTTRVWARAVRALAGVAPVYAWDLPGHGASPPAAGPFTMAELAAGLLRAADAAGLDTVDVAGVSLGGLAGLQLAADHPDRVRGVTLVCSLPRIGTREGWLQRAAEVRAMGTPVLVTASASRWFTPEFLAADPDLASRTLNGLLEIDDESYALCVDALRETDLWDALRPPLSVIGGVEDPVVPIAEAERAAAAGHGILHRIAGASHLATVEKPDEVTAAMIADRRRWESG